MESKKAQNLSITTIILIILGVVVLVVLIIGFTQGWGSVKGFFTGGQSELSQLATQCSVACASGDEVSWCQDRTIETNGREETGDCEFFSSYQSVEECADMVKCQDTIPGTLSCATYEYSTGKTATSCDLATGCVGGSSNAINPPKANMLWTEGKEKICCKLGCA